MILQEKVNLSLLFLLPLIAAENESWMKYTAESNLSGERDGAFVNGYNYDINKPWLDEHVFLMFDCSKKKEIKDVDLIFNKYFIATYTYRIKNKFYDIFVFETDKKFTEDREYILDGKYSKLSKEAKEAIISFWRAMPNTLLFQSLYGNRRTEVFQKIIDESIDECDYIGNVSDSL